MTSLSALLAEVRNAVDARLPALLAPAEGEPDPLDPLPAAVRDGLLSPGKRVRPALVVLSGGLFGAPRSRLLDAGAAIEMVHAASLVLDDLPLDGRRDDARGRPALHRAHGENVAILAAVTLLVRALGPSRRRACTRAERAGIPPGTALDLVSRLADASGLLGLASGQALDLGTGPADATFDRLETIHARKTGALFVASAEFGAVVGGALERSSPRSGRTRGTSASRSRSWTTSSRRRPTPRSTGESARRAPAPTFLRHVGEEGARALVAELTAHALDALKPFGKKADMLASSR